MPAKNLIPQRVRRLIRRSTTRGGMEREFGADRVRFEKYAATSDSEASTKLSGRNLETQITKDYHRVEKGLALRSPKRPFGEQVAQRLDMLIPIAETQTSAAFVSYARDARAALDAWNKDGQISDAVSPLFTTIGQHQLEPADVAELFTTRRSVRNFEPDVLVPSHLIEEAVRLAATTPSVCNRQPWRAHVFSGQEASSRTLAFQNGNAGFRDTVPHVAVITVDTRLFAGPGERNQPWIEGGLFAANFVLALHGLGVSTCMLNMSVVNKRAEELRAEIGIPDSELIIMMVAFGYPAPDYRVARSPRRVNSDILVRHGVPLEDSPADGSAV